MTKYVAMATIQPEVRQAVCNGDCVKIRRQLWEYQQRGEFCDMGLEADDGTVLMVHRAVISAGSPVIYNMVIHSAAESEKEKGLIKMVKLTGVSVESLRDIVQFIYIGSVEKINMATVALWDQLQMYKPIRLCDNKLETSKHPGDIQVSAMTTAIQEENEPLPTRNDNHEDQENQDGNHDNYNETLMDPIENTSAETSISPENVKANCKARTFESDRLKRKRECSAPLQLTGVLPKGDSYKVNNYDDDVEDEVGSLGTDDEPEPAGVEEVKEEEQDGQLAGLEGVGTKRRRTVRRTTMRNNFRNTGPTPVSRPPKKAGLPVGRPKGRPVGRTRGRPAKKPPIVNNTTSPKLDDPHQCKTCSECFDTAKEYGEHRENYHKGDRHKCIDCGLVFNRANRLKAHRVDSHYKEGLPEPTWHYCKVEGCKFKSIYGEKVTVHNKTVHLKEKVICELCGASFTQSCGLMYHKKRKHDKTPLPFPCDACEVAFDSAKHLQKHIDRVHNKRLNHLCDQCPYMAFDKISIDMHKFSRHGIPLPGENRTWHNCPYCDYKSVAKNVMQAHVERHEQKTFKCESCDSVFNCNLDLKTHRRNRHSNRPKVLHHCPYDGCKFVSKYGPATLKKHVSRIHENKDYKPWACDICDYRTNVKGNLHLHLRKVHGLQPQTNERRVPTIKPDTVDAPTNEDTASKSQPNSTLVPQGAVVDNTQSALIQTTQPSLHETQLQPTSQELLAERIPVEISPQMDHHEDSDQALLSPQMTLPNPQGTPPLSMALPSTHHPLPNHITLPHPPIAIPEIFHTISRDTAYQTVPRPETVRSESASSTPQQVPPVYQTLSQAESVPRLQLRVPVLPGTQYGMAVPPVAYDENLFMQGLQ